MKLRQQRGEINANVHTLRLQSAAASAIAEAKVPEAAAENEFEDVCYPTKREGVQLETANIAPISHQVITQLITAGSPADQNKKECERTVKNETDIGDTQSNEDSQWEFNELPEMQPPQNITNSAEENPHVQSSFRNAMFVACSRYTSSVTIDHRVQLPYDGQSASTFQPRQPQSRPVVSVNESTPSATTDLPKYLMRRELVSSVLLEFDDKPENYWAWKASFLNSIEVS